MVSDYGVQSWFMEVMVQFEYRNIERFQNKYLRIIVNAL